MSAATLAVTAAASREAHARAAADAKARAQACKGLMDGYTDATATAGQRWAYARCVQEFHRPADRPLEGGELIAAIALTTCVVLFAVVVLSIPGIVFYLKRH